MKSLSIILFLYSSRAIFGFISVVDSLAPYADLTIRFGFIISDFFILFIVFFLKYNPLRCDPFKDIKFFIRNDKFGKNPLILAQPQKPIEGIDCLVLYKIGFPYDKSAA